jgi:hypothetical protein
MTTPNESSEAKVYATRVYSSGLELLPPGSKVVLHSDYESLRQERNSALREIEGLRKLLGEARGYLDGWPGTHMATLLPQIDAALARTGE